MKLKILCAALFLAACFLLYIGAGMLLLIPGDLREGYFAAWRIRYGVLPLAASGLLLVTVGLLWSRSQQGATRVRATCGAFVLAAGLVVLAFLTVVFVTR
jgi:hypothetical protein